MDKIVIITGATSGIGLACAKKFAMNGDKLILTGRNEKRLAEIRQELMAQGTEVLTLAFDVRDSSKAKASLSSLPRSGRPLMSLSIMQVWLWGWNPNTKAA